MINSNRSGNLVTNVSLLAASYYFHVSIDLLCISSPESGSAAERRAREHDERSKYFKMRLLFPPNCVIFAAALQTRKYFEKQKFCAYNHVAPQKVCNPALYLSNGSKESERTLESNLVSLCVVFASKKSQHVRKF